MAGSLERLRAIYWDRMVPMGRRLRAAEHVMRYELGPGSAVGLEPHEIASDAYKFFALVAHAPDVSGPHRQSALEAMTVVENARAVAGAKGREQGEQRILTVRMVNAERSLALRAAGDWERVLRENRVWALRGEEEVEVRELPDQGLRRSPTDGIGDMLNRAQAQPASEQEARREARRAALRQVRAKNRADAWERLLELQTV